jgi:hypothetical protein
VERPTAGARICRRFEPAARCQDVCPPVIINISRPDAVAVAPIADDVSGECALPHLVPRLRCAILLRDDLVRLAVVVDVRQDRELDVEARMDLRFLPGRRRRCAPGILPPGNALREPRHGDDIGIAVAIHVDGQIAEVVDVLLGEIQIAEPVLRPRWRFVPVLARDDIRSPVVVDVGDRGRLARAEIDRVRLERNVGRAGSRLKSG